jgi:hypothetical protein
MHNGGFIGSKSNDILDLFLADFLIRCRFRFPKNLCTNREALPLLSGEIGCDNRTPR